MNNIYKMKNEILAYAWGTTDFIPNLIGTRKTDKPQAEMWMGAHLKASSRLEIQNKEEKLSSFISNNLNLTLGEKIASEFEGKLPFLLKILSAQKPLSIQVHPNKKQAIAGYRKDNEKNIDLLAFNRSYKDDNHKPELICALTEFDAMCGFQPVEEIQERLRYLNVLQDYCQEFLRNPTSLTFKLFYINLMNLSSKKQAELVADLITKIKNPRTKKEKIIFEWVEKLNIEYPGDIGVFSPIYLNIVRLHPGESLYLKAGIMHAYLQGTGIEIMANSDNVLRGGLTKKFIDLTELSKTIIFENEIIEKIETEKNAEENVYHTVAREFELSKIELKNVFEVNEIDSPEIILCTKGNAKIISENDIELKTGESAFINYNCRKYKLLGNGEFFRAKVPFKDKQNK